MGAAYQLAAAMAVILMGGLLFFEKKEITAGKGGTKLLLSSMFVAVAFAGAHPVQPYYRTMLAGFLFCLAGDVLLSFPAAVCFRLGLFAFLIAHIFYAAAFLPFLSAGIVAFIALPIIAIPGLLMYRWLSSHLADMKMPVIAYIIVISLMVYLAACASHNPVLPVKGKTLMLGGSVLFYLSYIFVARNRFVDKGFINRLIGLPLYYGGQFMLAFSVSAVGA